VAIVGDDAVKKEKGVRMPMPKTYRHMKNQAGLVIKKLATPGNKDQPWKKSPRELKRGRGRKFRGTAGDK